MSAQRERRVAPLMNKDVGAVSQLEVGDIRSRTNVGLICARQAADRKLDAAIREFAPELDLRHIGGLRIFGEPLARFVACFGAWQSVGLPPPGSAYAVRLRAFADPLADPAGDV